jgi:hypothetical protein
LAIQQNSRVDVFDDMARVDVFDDIHWAFFFVKDSGLTFVETTATSHSLSCACCPLNSTTIYYLFHLQENKKRYK